ncbi:MAG TPA: GIY-YIG nuclease family protein [Thermomicrobiales bacterium]|nr:GIY-YIG nuclease family protein [Thermomicrobiales bacterium]
MQKQFYVYILASYTQRLYIGVTSDLERRVWQHKNKAFEGHSAKYNIDRLVYVELFGHADDAIAREKQPKNWSRIKKVNLITRDNPNWRDLSIELFGWPP